MGLFHRREEPQSEVLYTVGIGDQKNRLIVGLGNPGRQYEQTRHNIGFMCLDAFTAAENGTWHEKKALKSLICELRIGQTRIILCKPQTFMNLSGEAVRAVQQFYKITNQDLAVVHDELDIPFGQIRTRQGGGAAGHNGVKSLIQHIDEDFGRIRVGVANEFSPKVDSADFVLQKFYKTELESMKALATEVGSLINEFAFGELPTDTRKFI